MRNVLIAWEIGGNLGHLGRLLPIATELIASGYRVTFAVPEGAQARQWLQERNWSVVDIPACVNRSNSTQVASCHADWFLQTGFGDILATVNRLALWAKQMSELKPDLILLDYAPFVTYAAHALSIDYFVLGTGFCVPPQFDKPTYFRPWDNAACKTADERHQKLVDSFAKLRTNFAGDGALSFADLFGPSRIKMCTYAELDHFPNRGDITAYFGATWSDFGDDQSVEFSDRSSDKALCYFNGGEQIYIATLRVLRKLNFEVIVIAPKLRAEAVAALSEQNLKILTKPMNLEKLFSRADLLVSHGGLGFAARAIALKKKLFLLPMYAEQLLLARRLVDQGLAGASLEFNDPISLSRRIQSLAIDSSSGARALRVAELVGYKTAAQSAQVIVKSLAMGSD